jgi:hypothetical protein
VSIRTPHTIGEERSEASVPRSRVPRIQLSPRAFSAARGDPGGVDANDSLFDEPSPGASGWGPSVKKIGTKQPDLGSSRNRGPSSLDSNRQLIAYVEDDDNWHVAKLDLAEPYELVRASSSPEACRLFTTRCLPSPMLMDVELRGSELDGVGSPSFFAGGSCDSHCPSM